LLARPIGRLGRASIDAKGAHSVAVEADGARLTESVQAFEQVRAFRGSLAIPGVAKASSGFVADIALGKQRRQGSGILAHPSPLALDQQAR
jgi:hypothetical protein